jgi:hypothetical protein
MEILKTQGACSFGWRHFQASGSADSTICSPERERDISDVGTESSILDCH